MIRNQQGKFEVPKDYQILYDQNRNYNEGKNEYYLPPYRDNLHPSIYKGITIEIQIVDHCNINCNCCNHFSPLAEKWYMPLDDFIHQMILLKNNLSIVKELIILGGEPLLHPNLLEICRSARNILGPDVTIDVLTNGTITKPILQNQQEYKELNIHFNFTIYKDYSKIDKIKEISPEIGKIYNTRVLSKQTLVDTSGSLDGFDNFFNCSNHKLPCLTLKDNKIYICPFCAHVEHFCKKFNYSILEEEWKDYLYLEKIHNNLDILQKFCFTPKNYCNYCIQETRAVIFEQSSKDLCEFTIPIDNLYFRDYPRYEKIMNNNKDHIDWCLSNKNPGNIDYVFQQVDLNNEIYRYGKGKIDIIIPYYNENLEQITALYYNLKSQTIIKDCVIYLISDNSNMDQLVMKIFRSDPELHCVFLRNECQKGPGGARNKALNNSYNDLILFLDADDLFVYNNSLELLYTNFEQDIDLLEFMSYTKDYTANKMSFIVKRNIISKNNLQYKEFYFGEDIEFFTELIAVSPHYKSLRNVDNIYIEYNATANNTNLTTTFIAYDTNHFSLLSSNFLGIYTIFLRDNIFNKPKIFELIDNFLTTILIILNNNDIDNLFVEAFIAYILYFIHNNIYCLDNYLKEFSQHNINIDHINFDILKNYLYDYINEYYINNSKLCNNAKYMLQILR